MAQTFADPDSVMLRAIELAMRGIGRVEPNPAVGAVIVDERLNLIAEGNHEEFGGPHAEVIALGRAGRLPHGARLFVTLEPCCHQGKTPPCATAVIAAGIKKVVVGMQDPALHAAGGGIAALRDAGVEVEVGRLHEQVCRLNAPFLKLIDTGFPYVHAKWAMTLDGRIASRTGHSQWISNAKSREVVHRLRGRMDAVLIGVGTALADDPLLTARPAGSRVAVRIVLDSQASLPPATQLVQTARQVPVILVVTESAPHKRTQPLIDAGVEVLRLPKSPSLELTSSTHSPRPDLVALLRELGHRRYTNLLVEGGGEVLGEFFDRELVDEVHIFVAPKLVGGAAAKSPMAGIGLKTIPRLSSLPHAEIQVLDSDVYVHGALKMDGRGLTDIPAG